MEIEVHSIPSDPQEVKVWTRARAGLCPQCNGLLYYGKLYKMSSPEGTEIVHKRCGRAFADRTGFTHPALSPQKAYMKVDENFKVTIVDGNGSS